MKLLIVRILCHAARVGLAAVFIVAGIVKLWDMPPFAASVGDFGLVYDSLVYPTAWLLAGTELLVGLALAFNVRGGSLAALVLLGLFIGVLSYGVWMGLDIHCGCFGLGYHVSLKQQLFTDAGLLLWWAVVYAAHKRYRITPVSPREFTRWVLDRKA